MSADLEQEDKQLKQELNVIFHRPILDPRHLKIAIIFNEYFFVYLNCFRNFRKEEEHEGAIIVSADQSADSCVAVQKISWRNSRSAVESANKRTLLLFHRHHCQVQLASAFY